MNPVLVLRTLEFAFPFIWEGRTKKSAQFIISDGS